MMMENRGAIKPVCIFLLPGIKITAQTLLSGVSMRRLPVSGRNSPYDTKNDRREQQKGEPVYSLRIPFTLRRLFYIHWMHAKTATPARWFAVQHALNFSLSRRSAATTIRAPAAA
jgi:hypothetical protein